MICQRYLIEIFSAIFNPSNDKKLPNIITSNITYTSINCVSISLYFIAYCMTLYLIVRTNHILPVPAKTVKHNILLAGNNISRVTGEDEGTDIPDSLTCMTKFNQIKHEVLAAWGWICVTRQLRTCPTTNPQIAFNISFKYTFLFRYKIKNMTTLQSETMNRSAREVCLNFGISSESIGFMEGKGLETTFALDQFNN